MKRQIVLWSLWGVVLIGSASAEDSVYFADARLKTAVEETLWIDDPTPNDMLSLTELIWLNDEIRDLTGLEYATNLQTLNLRMNHINDISILAALGNLEDLNLTWNQIENISVMSSLINLRSLNLHKNQISDISPLSSLTHLQWLDLHKNNISDISPLAGLTSLQYLVLLYNPLNQETCDVYIPQIPGKQSRYVLRWPLSCWWLSDLINGRRIGNPSRRRDIYL